MSRINRRTCVAHQLADHNWPASDTPVRQPLRERVMVMVGAPYELGPAAEGYPLRIRVWGRSGLSHPMLNRGTEVTLDGRRTLGLTGLLPSGESVLGGQVRWVYALSPWSRPPNARRWPTSHSPNRSGRRTRRCGGRGIRRSRRSETH
jgi:hypothetical protein